MLWLAVFVAACAPPTDPSAGTADWLVSDGVQACDAPLDAPAWADVARDWGLGDLGDPDVEHGYSAGAAYADLDGDGDDDVALAYPAAPVTVYWREPDRFVRAFALPVRDQAPRAVGVLDPDGDADPDLFIATQSATLDGGWAYLRNDGGAFTEAPEVLALTLGVAWGLPAEADFDADGDLDAYLPGSGEDPTARVDLLLRNEAGLLAATDLLPATEGALTLQAFWSDADDDGDPDVYAVNDFGPTRGGNRYFRNDGDGFADASEECACTTVAGGMSGDVGDINADGLPDFYLANADGNNLFLNLGGGQFVDAAVAVNATDRDTEGRGTMAWSAVIGDVDNDGRLDLYNTHGDFFSAEEPFEPTEAASVLLAQQADGTFADVAPAYGLDSPSSDRSVVADDMNGDGVLDLLVTVIDDWPHLWMSTGCTDRSWVEVEARLDGPNAWGIGARVTIEAGGRTRVGWLWPSSGLGATRTPRLHVGLGDAETIDRITVELPTGEALAAEGPIAARQRLRVADGG